VRNTPRLTSYFFILVVVGLWLGNSTTPVHVYALASSSASDPSQLRLAADWTWREFSGEVAKGAAVGAVAGAVAGALSGPGVAAAAGVGALAGAAAGAAEYAFDWVFGVQPRVLADTYPPGVLD